MSCTITDLVISLSPAGTTIPEVGKQVIVSPTQTPLFVETSSVFREIFEPDRILTTDNSGTWTVTLPWPSEQDPTPNSWIIELPDGSRWQGDIPEAVAGPLTLHTLKNTYNWSLLSSVQPTGSALLPVAIQGPPGPTGPTGATGPTGPTTILTWQFGTPMSTIKTQIDALTAANHQVDVWLDDLGTNSNGNGTGEAPPFVFDQPMNLDRVRFFGISRDNFWVRITFATGFQLLGSKMYFEGCIITTQTTIYTHDPAHPRYMDWYFRYCGVYLDTGAPPLAILGTPGSLATNAISIDLFTTLEGDTENGGTMFQITQNSWLEVMTYSQSYLDSLLLSLAPGATAGNLEIFLDETVTFDQQSYGPVAAGISLLLSTSGGLGYLAPDTLVVVPNNPIATVLVKQMPLQAIAKWSNGTVQDVTDRVQWSTSDGGLASVDSGIVTFLSSGTVTITASWPGGNAIGSTDLTTDGGAIDTSDLSYEAAVSTDWAGDSPPGGLQQAIDRIAAALRILNQKP